MIEGGAWGYVGKAPCGALPGLYQAKKESQGEPVTVCVAAKWRPSASPNEVLSSITCRSF